MEPGNYATPFDTPYYANACNLAARSMALTDNAAERPLSLDVMAAEELCAAEEETALIRWASFTVAKLNCVPCQLQMCFCQTTSPCYGFLSGRRPICCGYSCRGVPVLVYFGLSEVLLRLIVIFFSIIRS